MPLRRAGTIPSTVPRYGPAAAHRAARAARCAASGEQGVSARFRFPAPCLPRHPRLELGPTTGRTARHGARRGGRVVDRTALEMRHRCKPIGGSNPSLSAKKLRRPSIRPYLHIRTPRGRVSAPAKVSVMSSARVCATDDERRIGPLLRLSSLGDPPPDAASDDRDIEIGEDGGKLRTAIHQKRRRGRIRGRYGLFPNAE